MSIVKAIAELQNSLSLAIGLNNEKKAEALGVGDETEFDRRIRIAKVLHKLKNKANDMHIIICDLGMKDSNLVTGEIEDEVSDKEQ